MAMTDISSFPAPLSLLAHPARARGSALLVAVLLAACTSYGPGGVPQGATQAEAIASMGRPTGRYPNPDGGERLEFARGPFGKHTFMLDFDAAGHLQHKEQVLTEANFYALQIGMTKDEVLRRIGHPSDVMFLSRQQHQLWSYRYESPFCVWFQVSLTTADVVAELGNNFDPLCGPGGMRLLGSAGSMHGH